jgi:hypothetical protein
MHMNAVVTGGIQQKRGAVLICNKFYSVALKLNLTVND